MAAIKDCVKSDDEERLEEKKRKEQQEAEAAKSEKRQKWIVIGTVSAIALIANLLIYFFSPIPLVETFIPQRNAMAVSAAIDAAIKEYAQDHNGRVPETLNQLYGKYIPQQILSPDVLSRFVYKKTADTAYELILKTTDSQKIPDILFTQGRVAL
jgi:hypothetical protein